MKKFLSILVLVLAFLIIYFLQINFFNNLRIFNVKPNLLIIFIVVLGLFLGSKIGLAFGIFFGILLDIFLGKNLGTMAISLGIIGYLGGILNINFTKESRLTQIIIVFFSTIICESIFYFLIIIFLNVNIEIITFSKIVFIEAIYNVILTIIFYPLILKYGLILEKNFFKSTIRNSFYIR